MMLPIKGVHKAIFLFILFIIVLLVFLFLSYRVQTTFYSIETGKLQQPIKIALITDLHSCKYGKNEEPLLEIIHKEKPDIVLLGGDIYDDDLPIEIAEKFIGNLAQEYPTYYVSGNHEYWSEKMDIMKDITRKEGATVLDGQCVTFEKSKDTINICGIDDPTYIGLAPLRFNLNPQRSTWMVKKSTFCWLTDLNLLISIPIMNST